MADITPAQAKQIIRKALNERGMAFTKLTAQTVGFSDLARNRLIFVRIYGWETNPLYQEIRQIAVNNGFRIELDGSIG